MTVFPFVKRYYKGVSNSPDAYEHFYIGFIATLFVSIALLLGYKHASLYLLAAWLWHFVAKELIADGLG